MKLTYRKDIDGLRAIAVLAVILFHADIPGFTGGFIGVDVFFVISGFLITSIILKDIESGKFSIVKFYERRIRRIFPALFPVIAVTVIAGMFFLDYKTFKKLGQSVTATTVFASNILFWQDSGYFDSPSAQKPLLHTWSLAVEEQFYIFFPLLLSGINRFFHRRYFPLLIITAIISFATSIWWVYAQPSAAFYLVPARAWEMLAGAVLALGCLPVPRSRILRDVASITGLCLIFYSIAFYSKSTAFPGLNASVPVLGTALIIYSGTGGPSIAGKALSLKPIVFIGMISYSLYLWHWPIIVFSRYMLLHNPSFSEMGAQLLFTLILSTLSFFYVEQPFRRHQPLFPGRRALFAVSASVMAVASVTGLVIHLQNGMPYRSSANTAIMKNDDEYEWGKHVGTEKKAIIAISEGQTPPVIGSAGTRPMFLLWGDSHARVLSIGMSEMAKRYRLSGYLATNSGAPPIVVEHGEDNLFNGSHFNESVISFIKSHPEITTIIIASRWSAYGNTDNMHTAMLRKGIISTIDALRGLGRRIVIVDDVPQLGGDALRLYCVNSLTGSDYNELLPTVSDYRKSNQVVSTLFYELAKHRDVTLVSPESLLFDKNGKTILVNDDKLLYRDDNHLSSYGSMFVAPAFKDVFRELSGNYRM
jgi:peptidoglycan/LPS O-acetylase OafA/YrhL